MNLRETALRLLESWELDGRYINLVISSHILDSCTKEEKALLTSLLYTTVEHKITYDYYISAIAKRGTDKIDPRTLNILRLGMCQITELSSVPAFAAVNESVKLARNPGERSFVNGVLRTAARLYESGELPMPPYEKNPARYYSVKYSLPLWICKHFIAELAEEGAQALFEAFNKPTPMDITVNTTKISREKFAEELTRRGISCELSDKSPLSVRVNTKCSPRDMYGYDDGLFFVEDEASALAVAALSPEPGERVVDVCAAPGGKSMAAAVLMGNSGEVYSFDIRESKLSLITSSAERLGLSSVRAAVRDAERADEALVGVIDKLICDVPCSGLGVISKKSDLRYKDEDSIKSLPELQYNILRESSRYLKTGGELVYSTCTLLREENGDVISRFLSENPDFERAEFSLGSLESHDGMITLYPHIHETDGFFIAKIKRVK